MSFAASARRAAGLAGVLFGWRPDEFWAATPEELMTLAEAGGEEAAAGGDLLKALMEQYPDG